MKETRSNLHPHKQFLNTLYSTPLFRRTLARNVSAALEEDLGQGDIHVALYPESSISTAQVITREPAIVCGIPWVNETFAQLGDNFKIEWLVNEGDRVEPNQVLFKITGPTGVLLSGERTALNFLQLLMATANQTAALQDLIAHTSTRILDTRKTIPGLRLAQKYAVAVAGGANHRIGLWDAFLIKENHIAAAGGIAQAVAKAREFDAKCFLEVEVENLDELRQAITADVDRVLLDNFTLEQLREALEIRQELNSGCDFEASGNVDADSVVAIAETGVDYISVGGITKHIKATDLSFRIQSA